MLLRPLLVRLSFQHGCHPKNVKTCLSTVECGGGATRPSPTPSTGVPRNRPVSLGGVGAAKAVLTSGHGGREAGRRPRRRPTGRPDGHVAENEGRRRPADAETHAGRGRRLTAGPTRKRRRRFLGACRQTAPSPTGGLGGRRARAGRPPTSSRATEATRPRTFVSLTRRGLTDGPGLVSIQAGSSRQTPTGRRGTVTGRRRSTVPL